MAKNSPTPAPDQNGAPCLDMEPLTDGAQPTGIRFLYCSVGGTLVWSGTSGNAISISIQQGWHPIVPKSINLSATTATVFRCY